MNGIQTVRASLPVTWGEMAAALTHYYGEKRATAVVERLKGWQGLLNCLDQCGDLRKLSGPIDGSLVTGGVVPYGD